MVAGTQDRHGARRAGKRVSPGVVTDDPAGLSVPNQHHVFYRTTNGTPEHRFIDDTTGRLTTDNWGGAL